VSYLKIKNNFQNLLPNKDKNEHIKLTSNKNNKSNLSKNLIEEIPLLTNIEFKWIENYY
jgi:hypothetical protein